jgi:hypothetical protein
MNKKNNKNDAATIHQLLDAIRTEQQSIDRHEGDVIVCQIRLAAHLAELRQLANRTWGKQLKALGMSPRVGSRYLKIAQHWTPEIGLNESDLLLRLPTDLLKLEWLCRVPLQQLRELVTDLDCKKASRSKVIAAVRETLGEEPSAEVDVEEFVRRFINRLVGTVGRLDEKFPDPEQQNRARELLRSGIRKVQETLQESGRGNQ